MPKLIDLGMKLIATFLAAAAFGLLPARAEDYDVYINDDGLLCSVMVDFEFSRDQFSNVKEDRELFIRRHLVAAVRSIPQGQCSQESELELFAIMVPERDSYGQPHWGSVEYLSEYRASFVELQATSSDDLNAEVLSALLEKVSK